MTLFIHASAGAILSQYAGGNPVIAFFYGLVSHFILDMIPHGDSKLYEKYKNKELSLKRALAKSIIDSIATIILIVGFFNLDLPVSRLAMSMGLIGSVIPDVMIGFYELFYPKVPRFLRLAHKWHFKNHNLIAKKFDFTPNMGLIFQILVFIVLLNRIF